MKHLLKYTWIVIAFVVLSTSVSWGLTKSEIYTNATTYEMGKPDKIWSRTEFSKPYVQTARQKGYNCAVGQSVKQESEKSPTKI